MGLSGPPAWAQDSDEARAKELYQNGAILFEEGRYSDAIIAWKEAYRLSQRPQLLFNIANAAERSGQLQEAFDALNLYRQSAPEDERDALERRMRALAQRINEASGPPTAPAIVAPSTQTPPPSEDSGGRSLALPLALYGVGAVGVGVGTFSGLRALAARRDAATLCTEDGICPDEAEPLLRADRNASLLADIGFGVGAAGVVGGTLSLLLGGQPTAVGLHPTWGVGPGWAMTWTGSF